MLRKSRQHSYINDLATSLSQSCTMHRGYTGSNKYFQLITQILMNAVLDWILVAVIHIVSMWLDPTSVSVSRAMSSIKNMPVKVYMHIVILIALGSKVCSLVLLKWNTYSFLDIDECKRQLHDCDTHALCRNTLGGFQCMCNKGFIGNGTVCHPTMSDPCGKIAHFIS